MDEETDTWVAFSEIGINARMRNALELFEARQRAAPAAGLGGLGLTAGASTSANGRPDEAEIKTATANGGSESGGVTVSATREGSSADLKRRLA